MPGEREPHFWSAITRQIAYRGCRGTLGLEPAQLADHIGWDPGAAEVARRLSGHLDAPLGLSGYSRLAVDCNRPPDSRESITERAPA